MPLSSKVIDFGTRNGTTNGITNGATNGVSNGVSNGISKGVSNGTTNGASNGVSHGIRNGIPNGTTNGISTTKPLLKTATSAVESLQAALTAPLKTAAAAITPEQEKQSGNAGRDIASPMPKPTWI